MDEKKLNEVVEEPKKEEIKSTVNKTTKKDSAVEDKKTPIRKTSATKKTSTGTKKTSSSVKKTTGKVSAEKSSAVAKKKSGAASIEKALETKKVTENAESAANKDDMKSRMQRIINASKKLNDSILDEDTKKAQMKEKLANAAQEMEEEYGHVEEERTAADSYSEKNSQMKDKYADLSKKLAAMMAEADNYQEPLEDEVVEDSNTVVEDMPLDDVISEPAIIEEEKVNEEVVANELIKDDIVVENVTKDENEVVNNITLEETNKENIVSNEVQENSQNKKSGAKIVLKKMLDYIIKTMNGMAYGLFATLIIGTILGTIGSFFKEGSGAYEILIPLSTLLKNLTGFGIGLGIAFSLKYDGIKLIAMSCVGAIAAYFSGASSAEYGFKIGDPLTVYIVVVVTSLIFNQIFRKKTPVDIIIVPLFTALFSSAFTAIVSKYIMEVTSGLADFLGTATEYQPIIMGIVIAVLMGMALTAPISSAAIAAIVFSVANGTVPSEGLLIASGAAAIGCCTQMVGFAIMSRKDNNIGTCLAIGIGTSMLQFKNILRKPIIWLPTIIVSAILGPIATTLIELQCMGTNAGMGTSGLVGMIGTFDTMGYGTNVWLIVIGFEILLPLVLVFIVDVIFRKCNLIKKGDLKL